MSVGHGGPDYRGGSSRQAQLQWGGLIQPSTLKQDTKPGYGHDTHCYPLLGCCLEGSGVWKQSFKVMGMDCTSSSFQLGLAVFTEANSSSSSASSKTQWNSKELQVRTVDSDLLISVTKETSLYEKTVVSSTCKLSVYCIASWTVSILKFSPHYLSCHNTLEWLPLLITFPS